MWLLFIIISVNIINVDANIGTITFDTPGNYQLTPADYHYSPQIIVEMWGAGGGGCSGDCGIGGGSGAYIKATINTNLETFNLTIGLGGKGGDGCQVECDQFSCNYPWYRNSTKYSGFNGTDTTLASDNNNLIAGGGIKGNITIHTCHSGYNSYNCYNNGGIYFINHINGYINQILNGNSGTLGYNKLSQSGCIQINNFCHNNYLIGAGNGGNSPYGSIGGIGANVTHCPSVGYGEYCNPYSNVNYWTAYSINGSIGSGGGGTYDNGYICAEMCQYIMSGGCYYKIFQQAGYGGNGTITITYQSSTNITPSTTSCTPSTTNFYQYQEPNHTNTPSTTCSATLSPTASQSSSITYSPTSSTNYPFIFVLTIFVIMYVWAMLLLIMVLTSSCLRICTRNCQ